MKPAHVVLAALMAFPATLPAADREFNDVVRVISDQFHTRPLHIPLFGLVNTVAFIARPAGAKHIDLAIFEDLESRDRDGQPIAETIRHAVGDSWKPFVRVQTSRDGRNETVLVYMRAAGQDWKLLIASVEPREATVVQVKLNPEGLQRWLAAPEFCARHWNRDSGAKFQNDDKDER